MDEKPVAVYVTSPDYLGNMVDIAGLATVAHRHGCLLAVDNAHGAYLKFLDPSRHPMDLGADLCCSSAHKTLPVLTGGAYLHTTPALSHYGKQALALFGSTSPSYLILQTLDAANKILAEGYASALAQTGKSVAALKQRLAAYQFLGDEPCKLTIDAKAYGYSGTAFADHLRKANIECEFADPDFVVLMISPETGEADLQRLEKAMLTIEKCPALTDAPPCYHVLQQAMTIREAILSGCETIPADECEGRILATATVGCPPAVPIAICGERLDEYALQLFRYYGIGTCCVVKE
jgi:arginine/lysine/ornithine decarboxylase